MNKIWIITRRELQTFFDSLPAYIMIVAFLGFSGFFTWLFTTNVFYSEQASLLTFFNVAFWTLFFFIPALTMGLLAEENKTGTIELLLTKPISDWQILLGKFLSTLILITIALLLTLPYYISIANIGKIDHGAVILGYLGLLLMSATYISIGLFASSISNNQIVAFLLALAIGICFHFIFDAMSSASLGFMGKLFSFLSVSAHFESISRGVFDSKDFLFFVSLTFFGLIATEAVLARKRY